jgi:hypothetical protein
MTRPVVAQKVIETKKGVQEVFEDNPELALIGSPEQYSEYLDSVFPNSKIKDIVYRATRDSAKLEASDLDPEKGTGSKNLGKGIYMAKEKSLADKYKGETGRTTAFIADVPNFFVIALQKNWDRGYYPLDQITVNQISEGTSDTLLNFENLDRDSYVQFNKYTGKYIGPVDVNGFPTYQTEIYATPYWTQFAVNSNKQLVALGSKQDIKGFKEFVSGKPTTQPSTSVKSNMISDSIKDTQLDLFNQTPLTFGGKSINEQLEIMNTPEFKSFFAEETIKNPNLDASEALDYYIKCKGL